MKKSTGNIDRIIEERFELDMSVDKALKLPGDEWDAKADAILEQNDKLVEELKAEHKNLTKYFELVEKNDPGPMALMSAFPKYFDICVNEQLILERPHTALNFKTPKQFEDDFNQR